MITRYAEKVRAKVEVKLRENSIIDWNMVDFDSTSLYPSLFNTTNIPYQKEANIMVNKIRRGLKDKHNMTKKKYRFLNRQLWKYLLYTTESRMVKHMRLSSSDFDGDKINQFSILTPANPEAPTSRQLMFKNSESLNEKCALTKPIFSANLSIPEEDETHMNFITQSEADKLHFIESSLPKDRYGEGKYFIGVDYCKD